MARPESSLFEQTGAEEQAAIDAAEAIGARARRDARRLRRRPSPAMSLQARQDERSPGRLCRRPWSLMYFTAHGRALPCCIAPFSARGYDSYTLGDATQQTLREIWNGPAYRHFRAALLTRDAAKAVPGLRAALEPVRCRDAGRAPVIPVLNEAGAIGPTVAALPRDVVDARDRRRWRQPRRDRRRGPRRRRRGAGRATSGLRPRLRRGRGARRAALGADDHAVPRRRRRRSGRARRPRWSAPVLAGEADFVLATRTRGPREAGSMGPTRCWPAG